MAAKMMPNGTKESVITHSATASWAGFVYQGLCALCVAMEKLLVEADALTWHLNIEGYEDFAILNAEKHVLSFHQCKDYKANTSMAGEFKKMEDKRAYWHDKGLCEETAGLWFHTNMTIEYSHGVRCYSYRDGSSNPNASEIFDILKRLVEEYCKKNVIPVSSDKAANRLIAHVEKVISEIDVQDKKEKENTQQISIEHSVAFKVIDDLIRTAEDHWTLDEKVRLSVFYMGLYLKECMDDESEIDITKVLRFLNRVKTMDNGERLRLVKCLFPDIDFESAMVPTAEYSNSPRVNYLYKVLTQTVDELDWERVHWQNEGICQSPSTMGNDMSAKRYCGRIATNTSLPPELLRDYDWIVGCFDESVEDILGTASTITRIKPIEYDDIIRTRKTGLLSIKDKNDGRL